MMMMRKKKRAMPKVFVIRFGSLFSWKLGPELGRGEGGRFSGAGSLRGGRKDRQVGSLGRGVTWRQPLGTLVPRGAGGARAREENLQSYQTIQGFAA